VTDILNKPEVLGQSPGVNRYISNLRNNLLQNTSLVVDPVGLSLAMYKALDGLTRKHQQEAVAIFPEILRQIKQSGPQGEKFAMEAEKFTSQFQKSIRTMAK
ncbi:MAG: hypothetical protein KW788_04590, partial [Candidatus Doudnabacteria bacterium]|nr:hypothetical protein [Candidatus Doudnabacteria bacterium]